MTKAQLLELVVAAAEAGKQQEVWVVNEAALLGTLTSWPEGCPRPAEAVLAFPGQGGDPGAAAGQGGAWSVAGEASARLVNARQVRLPEEWLSRAVVLESGRIRAVCPEVHDTAVACLISGRPGQLELLGLMVRQRLADAEMIRRRLFGMSLDDATRGLCFARLYQVAGL